MLEPLQLELQEIVRGMWVLGTEPEFFVRAARIFTAQLLSPAPIFYFLRSSCLSLTTTCDYRLVLYAQQDTGYFR